LSLDEAYLDVTENLKGNISVTKIAEEIWARIPAETRLTASPGGPITGRSPALPGRGQKGDGVDAPRRHQRAKVTVPSRHLRRRPWTSRSTCSRHTELTLPGMHYFRERIMRPKLLGFLAAHAPCTIAMEACAGAHYWAREIAKLGHSMRLIPPVYVKPFVKRQKNDAADAEAICEAAQRPSMRFVPVKTEEQQANGVVFRARDLLVHHRSF
jgi:hypothetical protein